MPEFLTKEQFLKTKAGQKKGASYQGYKSWVEKTRTKRSASRSTSAPSGTGFGQYTDPRILQQQAMSLYPQDSTLTPFNNQQLNSQAQGIVNPIFQNAMKTITDQIAKTSQLGSNAIAGYNQQYQNQLPAIQNQVKGIYDSAKGEMASTNQALADFIRNQGQAATNELAGASSAAGQTDAGAALTAGYGAGSSAATAAYGGSALERLIGAGAAEQAFTAQLPAFARAEQTQTLGNFLGGQQSLLREGTANLQGQLPQTLQDVYQNLLSRELTKTGMRQQRNTSVADFYNAGLNRNVEARALEAQVYANNADRTQNQSQFESTQSFSRQQFDFEKEQAGIVAGTEWDKKFEGLAPTLEETAVILSRSQGPNQPGLSFGKIRGRLAGIVRGRLGKNVPPRMMKFYIDQALRAAGWQGPPRAASKNGPQIPDFALDSIFGGTYGQFPAYQADPASAGVAAGRGQPTGSIWGTFG